MVAIALGSINTESGRPSASDSAALIEEVKSAGGPVIFTENIENSGVTNQVALEAGVKVGAPLSIDALGAPGTVGDTYLKMMRQNTQAIVSGLQP
jgi:ABC-type Zn uptake system ZnuABC Zn-binding protein ZnuA